MGFTRNILDAFTFAGSVGVYRSIEKCEQLCIRPRSRTFTPPMENEEYVTPIADRMRGTRALHIQEAYASVPKDSFREPIPVPNCFCVINRGVLSTNGYQVMTQGSGDLVASLCSDAWDGQSLSALTEADKGKLLDFYNRNVSTAYCQAFAYVPFLNGRLSIVNRKKKRMSNQRDKQKEAFTQESDKFIVLELPVNFELQNRLVTEASKCASSVGAFFQRKKSKLFCSPSRSSKLSSCSFQGIHHVPKPTPLGGSVSKLTLSPRFSCPGSPTIGEAHGDYSTSSSPTRRIDTRRRTHLGIRRHHLKRRRYRNLSRATFSCASFSYLQDCEDSIDPSALQEALSKQVFLGMISLQYQAVPGIVETVRKLNQACIRFVHFSQDNQLRSRVFAERLGLEADWNCHISLSNNVDKSAASSPRILRHVTSHSPAPSNTIHRPSSIDSTGVPLPSSICSQPHDPPLFRFKSLSAPTVCQFVEHQAVIHPSARPTSSKPVDKTIAQINEIEVGEKIWFGEAPATDNLLISFLHSSNASSSSSSTSSSTSFLSASEQICGDGALKALRNSSVASQMSTSPTTTVNAMDGDNFTSAYNYVFSNKSRLPSGIKNIRTHLENVDNVPLKVSLFTDSTLPAVRDMITIMQEYGETVCVLGSCLSMANTELFCTGDTAIAVFPILPEVCGNENAGCHGDHHPTSTKKRSLDSSSSSSSSSSEHENAFSELFHSRRRRANRQRSLDSAYESSYQLNGHRKSDGQHSSDSISKKRLLNNSEKHPGQRNDLLSLAGQLIGLAAPLICDADFDLLKIIIGAHASVTNIRDCLLFAIAASCSSGLFYLLSIACIPAVPVLLDDSSLFQKSDWISSNESASQQFVWLPPVLLGSSWPLYAISDSNLRTNQTWVEVVKQMRYSTGCIAFGGNLFWLVLLAIPLISISIFGRTIQRKASLRQPPVKRTNMYSPEQVRRLVKVNVVRFLPSVLVCLVSHFSHIFFLCPTRIGTDFVCLPSPLSVNDSSSEVSLLAAKQFFTHYTHVMPWVMLSEEIVFFQLVVCLVLISFSFANWGQWGYKFRPSTNLPWLLTASLILTFHSIYLTVRLTTALSDSRGAVEWPVAHPAIFICGLLWCPLLLLINEIVNWRERKAIHAENRCTKLFFDTKLGMYSPV